MFTSFRFLSLYPTGILSEVDPGTGLGEATPSTPNVASATPAQATPSASAPPVAIPQASAAPATGGEDRSSWVPPHRLRETREAAIRQANESFSQREAQIRAEADRYRQQVMALTGVTPPPNPEIKAVRDQFGSLYPGLSKLEERAAQLEQLLERQGDMEAQTGHYWQRYGQQSVDRIFDKVTEAIGSPLTDEAKGYLHNAFVGFVQSTPERTDRYANDPTLVDEFVRAYTSNFIDPIRRSTGASIVNRAGAPVPQDGPSGTLRTGTPAPKPQSLDERVAMGWAAYKNPKA